MAEEKGRKGVKATIAILAVLLLVVGVIAIWQYATRPIASTTPQDTTNQTETPVEEEPEETPTDEEATEGDDTTTEDPDPATFSSLDLEPVGLTVFYTKGIPGFEYEVMGTGSGTRYISFISPELVGTKCTDDKGIFASLIENPSETDSQTVDLTTKIGTNTYGLSLASDTCTSNTSLLEQYQTAFKNGFGSLRAMREE